MRRAGSGVVFLAVFATASALPVDASPQQPKAASTLWASAKRFFVLRDHLRTKIAAAKAAGGGGMLLSNTTRTTPVIMPSSFALSYKTAVRWFCNRPEAKASAKVCSPGGDAGKAATGKAGALGAPTILESKDIVKLYCSVKEHKQLPLCAMSTLKYVQG